jgi:prepilin-type N-terminal cleavage/methylation domain-containing protein|tara:strand:- start:69 stop:536 length:468 start_codon:yes stop_codon:yes gene_type:complete
MQKSKEANLFLHKKTGFFIGGFTLVELLVVVALIGILASIGIPAYNGYVGTVKQKDAQNVLQTIYMKQKSYYNQNFCYYKGGTASEINVGLFGSVDGLVDGPIAVATNPYTYKITGTESTTCSGSKVATYTATATSKTDLTTIYSITDSFKKTGF